VKAATVTDEPIDKAAIVAAMQRGDAVVCLAKCWPCQFGDHFGAPTWHTWADDEDGKHARDTGQPDPRESRCGCRCADAPPPSPERNTQ
jgi:hypothetical protein